MTSTQRFAAVLAVPALALVFAAGTASASPGASPAGGGGGSVCREPYPADGLSVHTCAT
jgi:hypothetical protein